MCFDGLRWLGENDFDFTTFARELHFNECVEKLSVRGMPYWFARLAHVTCVLDVEMDADDMRVLLEAFNVNTSVRMLAFSSEESDVIDGI